MRLVMILNIFFMAVNPCVDFWKEWKRSSSESSGEERFISDKQSFADISENTLTITCGNEALDYDLIPCLNDTRIQIIIFKECYMSNFDVGRFVSNNDIVRMEIIYNTKDDKVEPTKNFESAHFKNMPELKYLKLEGLRTSETLNLSFDNVPSLTYLKIENFNFTSLLPRPFQQLTNLSELYIDEGSLKFSSEDDFYGLYNLRELFLYDVLLDRIPPNFFRHLIRLENLLIASNSLRDLPSDLLRSLSNLKQLTIHYNHRLTYLPPGFLSELRNLKELYITSCSLFVIEENIFDDLINLTNVRLSGNRIQNLPSKLFKNNRNLKKFVCSNNELTSLPSDIFHGLLKLKEIHLSQNRLESLSEDVFQNLSSLELIDLSINNITFIPENIFISLNNLRLIRLAVNKLTLPDGRLFRMGKNMRFLFMYDTGLTKLPMINWTAHDLITVNFNKNRFDSVKLPIYTPNRMKIHLTDCGIKTIYLDDRKYGLNAPTYRLKGNRLTCDHDLQPFVFAVKSNLEISLKMFPDINYMKCSEEERNVIDNRPFISLRNHCPKDCKCYRIPEGAKLDCAEKRIVKIPEVLIENAIMVNLSYNAISKHSRIDCETWKNVTRLYLSNNSLTDFPVYPLPPSLNYLSLDGNRLTQLPPELMNVIDDSSEFRIFLSNNRWNCDCDSGFTKTWLLRNKVKILDFQRVSCQINSTSSSFAEILSGNYCQQLSADNLTLANTYSRD